MNCEKNCENVLKSEYIDVINTLYLQGYIEDIDGKTTDILHTFLNLFIKKEKEIEMLKNRIYYLTTYINTNSPFKVGGK